MAVFYKYQYTNKRKNIHPCFSCLIASLRCTEFNTHKLNQSALSVRPVSITYLMLSVILHSSLLLQKQCWSQEQGLASWGRRCMASASPGVSSIDIGHRQLTYSDSAWTVLMPPWSLMMNLSPIRQLATSRSNCKALKVCQYKKLLVCAKGVKFC